MYRKAENAHTVTREKYVCVEYDTVQRRHSTWRGRQIIWVVADDSRQSIWRGRQIIWVTTLWGIVDDGGHGGFWGIDLSRGTGRAVCHDTRGWWTVELLHILQSQLATRFTTRFTTYCWNTYIYHYMVQCRNDTQGRWIVQLEHVLESQLAPRCNIYHIWHVHIFSALLYVRFSLSYTRILCFTTYAFFALLHMHFSLNYICIFRFTIYCSVDRHPQMTDRWTGTHSRTSARYSLYSTLLSIYTYILLALLHMSIDIRILYYIVQCGKVWTHEKRYRVAKTHRMPYLWRSFSAEEPYN